MSTENQLALLQQNLPTSQFADDKTFASMSSSGKYLPRIQVCGGASKIVKAKKIQLGVFGLIKSATNIIDLGERFDCLPLAWRPLAAMLGGDQVVSYYDPKTDDFKRVQAQAGIKDSGCVFGPEFLLYIPKLEEFATFHMNNKSAQREAPNLKGVIGKFACLNCKFIETTQYSWHGPEVLSCNTEYPVPDYETIVKPIVENFVKPPATQAEVIDPNDEAARDR